MLHLWVQKCGERATGNNLERALKQIGREDVISRCMHNIKEVTDIEEKAAARVYLDSAGKFLILFEMLLFFPIQSSLVQVTER